MPPNRFESEVESFLEGSHGDRTHIKRADHPRLHHYAGRYFNPTRARASKGDGGFSWARAKATPVSRERFPMQAGHGRSWSTHIRMQFHRRHFMRQLAIVEIPGISWSRRLQASGNCMRNCEALAEGATGVEGAGGHRRAWLRRPWAVAGPGRASSRCAEPHISDQAPLVWRAPEGPEGTGGLRGAAPNEVRPPSLAGGRALRRLEHQRGHKRPSGTGRCHNPRLGGQ